jgi:septal ring factor EnvC (AmiA/AmiB activator)
MVRVLASALIIAIAAAVGGWVLYTRDQAARAEQQRKTAELEQELQNLQDQNSQLKGNLAKSQSEEERLSAANQALSKVLAQARLTGKIPPLPPEALPYPPK